MYSYENYRKVKDEIENRRTRAIAEADSRAEQLREISKEIDAVDKELSGTGLLLFKTACEGGSIEPIKEKNRLLRERRASIIKKLGYPEDYTDVKYTCPVCSDTGYTPDDRVCACFKEALVKQTILSSGIGDLINKQSFETFDLEKYSYDNEIYELMKDNLKKAKQFVSEFKRKKTNLFMLGNTGTGKTHLSTSIAREIINLGYDVVYDSATNIISDFEDDKFGRGNDSKEKKSAKYLECDLLIIDDLGTEFTTQFSISCIYNLINTRINRGVSTIVSTNLDADALREKYDDRIFSRLIGAGKSLLFRGRDLRINRKP